LRLASDLAASTVCAPCAARAFAMARPIPRLPPVITATFPDSSFDMDSSFPERLFIHSHADHEDNGVVLLLATCDRRHGRARSDRKRVLLHVRRGSLAGG